MSTPHRTRAHTTMTVIRRRQSFHPCSPIQEIIHATSVMRDFGQSGGPVMPRESTLWLPAILTTAQNCFGLHGPPTTLRLCCRECPATTGRLVCGFGRSSIIRGQPQLRAGPGSSVSPNHRARTFQCCRWARRAWLASQPSGNLTGTLRWTGSVEGWASRSSGMPARATTMQAWRCLVVSTHRRPASRWNAVASRRPDRGCRTITMSNSRPCRRLAVSTVMPGRPLARRTAPIAWA